MPKTKRLKPFKFYCSICKDHYEFFGTNEKDAKKKFTAQGHEHVKVRRLQRGIVGVYKSAAQLAREIQLKEEAAEAKRLRG